MTAVLRDLAGLVAVAAACWALYRAVHGTWRIRPATDDQLGPIHRLRDTAGLCHDHPS